MVGQIIPGVAEVDDIVEVECCKRTLVVKM